MTTASTSKQKPVHKISRGGITVAVWKNDSPKGVWFNVTLSRSYKKDEEWAESSSYGQDDLLPLAKLLDEADSYIQGAQQAARRAA